MARCVSVLRVTNRKLLFCQQETRATTAKRVTEDSQGQPRSGAAPGPGAIENSAPKRAAEQPAQLDRPFRARYDGSRYPGAAPLRGCPWLPSITRFAVR